VLVVDGNLNSGLLSMGGRSLAQYWKLRENPESQGFIDTRGAMDPSNGRSSRADEGRYQLDHIFADSNTVGRVASGESGRSPPKNST